MKKPESIITPQKYLHNYRLDSPLFDSELCSVFFNNAYLDYFKEFELNLIIKAKAISIYAIEIELQRRVYIAVIRNGASLSSIDFECLIYLGFTRFVFFGYACGLDPNIGIGSVALVDRAYIGEGVSRYYACNEFYNNTSTQLNSWIQESLSTLHFDVESAICYSTEALFMETSLLVNDLIQKGVNCIDMECSALLSIANYRNVNASFIFCISDLIVENRWFENNGIDLRHVLVDVFKLLYIK